MMTVATSRECQGLGGIGERCVKRQETDDLTQEWPWEFDGQTSGNVTRQKWRMDKGFDGKQRGI